MPDSRDLAVAFEPSAGTRSAEPRRAIVDALVRTIALEGYERTTIDLVLLAAGVPAPVFDEHFEDKQDCLLAALDELIAGVERIISERVEHTASWPERVRAGLQALLDTLAANPQGARVLFVECLSAGEPAFERVRSAMASFVCAVEAGRGGAPGGATAIADLNAARLPALTSEAIVGGVASIIHRRVLEGNTAALPALLPDLLYFVLMPYLGHEHALTASASASVQP